MENPEFLSVNQPPLDQQFTKNRFVGKTVVVTGGASGIGFAVVERFVNDGANVTIFDKSAESGKLALENLKRSYAVDVRLVCVDVCDKKECITQVQKVAETGGGNIDALVNSAVYFGSKGLKSEKSDWMTTFNVNVIGTSNMVQAVCPLMREGGSIVNITSISAHRAQLDRWTYAASKGAIKTVTQNMALDLSKKGIRVNSVSPGWTWTPQMAKASPDGTLEPMIEGVKNFQLIPRAAHTSEVASAIVFLCSRDASYITGTDLVVDGGYTAIGPERFGEETLIAGDVSTSPNQ